MQWYNAAGHGLKQVCPRIHRRNSCHVDEAMSIGGSGNRAKHDSNAAVGWSKRNQYIGNRISKCVGH